jgi:hypothetical protein
MNTDTPRTDEATLRAIDIEGGGEFQAVHIQVSKQLERELTAARAEIERLDTVGIHSCHDNCQRWTCVLRRERDEARAEICHMVSENGNMYLEIFIARNQRDRLAEALWNMLNQEHGSAVKARILLRSLNLQYLNPNTPN